MADVAFSIKRGDTFSANIAIKDSEGNAVNLTGKTIFFTAKKWIEDTDAQAVINEEVVDIVSPADGTVTINLTAEQTALIKPGVYWWDIQTVDGSSVLSTTKQRMRVTPDVTIRTLS